jgi:hypothetical protein
MGVNTNNMDPEVLKFVDRRIEFSGLQIPVRSKEIAHSEDRASY